MVTDETGGDVYWVPINELSESEYEKLRFTNFGSILVYTDYDSMKAYYKPEEGSWFCAIASSLIFPTHFYRGFAPPK